MAVARARHDKDNEKSSQQHTFPAPVATSSSRGGIAWRRRCRSFSKASQQCCVDFAFHSAAIELKVPECLLTQGKELLRRLGIALLNLRQDAGDVRHGGDKRGVNERPMNRPLRYPSE